MAPILSSPCLPIERWQLEVLLTLAALLAFLAFAYFDKGPDE